MPIFFFIKEAHHNSSVPLGRLCSHQALYSITVKTWFVQRSDQFSVAFLKCLKSIRASIFIKFGAKPCNHVIGYLSPPHWCVHLMICKRFAFSSCCYHEMQRHFIMIFFPFERPHPTNWLHFKQIIWSRLSCNEQRLVIVKCKTKNLEHIHTHIKHALKPKNSIHHSQLMERYPNHNLLTTIIHTTSH